MPNLLFWMVGGSWYAQYLHAYDTSIAMDFPHGNHPNTYTRSSMKEPRGFRSFINFGIFPNFSYIVSPLLSFCCFFLLSSRVLDLYPLSISRSSSKLRTSRIEKGSLSLSLTISRSPLQIVSLFLSVSQSVFWDFFFFLILKFGILAFQWVG